MSNPLQTVKGKVFQDAVSKRVFGTIRPLSQSRKMQTLTGKELEIYADDDCDNVFTVDRHGAVWFWDHETDELMRLANSVAEFVASCSALEPVELKPGQVKSVWINPAFAKSRGMDVPPNGWVKKRENDK